MAILNILTYPDRRLRRVAEVVTEFGEPLKKLAADMLETMYQAEGIGLAATQVNVHKRVIVLDVSPDHQAPLILVNPVILKSVGASVAREGCLSVPGYYEEVERPARVSVQACDCDGGEYVLDAEGLLATCIQHEVDHLNGKVFVDYLSPIKRTRVHRQFKRASLART